MKEMALGAPEEPTKMIPRDKPVVSPQRAALVKDKQELVRAAKAHWKKDFDRMRRNMKFASGKQWPSQKDEDDRYQANLVQRVIKQMVASLYAKNPVVIAERRRKMEFQIWDEQPESLQMAVMALEAAQDNLEMLMTQAPQAAMLLAEVEQVKLQRAMMDKLGRTLVLLAEYYMTEGNPPFKLQMKQLMRRTRTTGVGYIRLGFERAAELSDTQKKSIADMSEQLATIGQMQADIQDGEADPQSAVAEELRLAIQGIQQQPEVIVREGVVFSFPHSTRIIPSIGTEKLMGWVGADWVAEEIPLTVDEIKRIYGIDVGKNFSPYKLAAGAPQSAAVRPAKAGEQNCIAVVWHLYDKATGLEYKMVDGYDDFLEEPGPPRVFIEQFFPWFAITFNDVEDEGRLFPNSDVENIKHIQMEFNRTKEALRQHRIASRPLYVASNGVFEQEDAKNLANHAAHDVITLNNLKEGQKASDLLQPVMKIPIDPNFYETGTLFDDLLRVTGNQEATLGGTGNGTATETTIAENSRAGAIGLDADDLDDMLSMLMRAVGQLCLTELGEETVKDIVGPGAVWPQLTRLEIMKEIGLRVQGGSSGKPNSQAEAAKFERIAPTILQVPGISPKWFADKAIRILDADVDLSEAYIEGLPSILGMNKMAQASTGDPATDPNEQGDEGGNKERAQAPGGTGQPEYPTGGAGGAMA